MLEKKLAALLKNKDIMLEVLTACRNRKEASFKKSVAAYDQAVGKDVLKEYAACLEGGDAEAGEDVFFNFGAAQCMRCHKVGRKGSDVGPNLSGIGKERSKDYLLQAIVDPAAVVAPGFGLVSLTLKNGKSGTVLFTVT